MVINHNEDLPHYYSRTRPMVWRIPDICRVNWDLGKFKLEILMQIQVMIQPTGWEYVLHIYNNDVWIQKDPIDIEDGTTIEDCRKVCPNLLFREVTTKPQ